jgi:hypothetical protein
MVIRVAVFNEKPALHEDKERIQAFRDWMKSQPGFHSAWHAHDSKTGQSRSISVWQDMASLMAMKDRAFPGGPIGQKPDKIEVFDEAEEF